MHKHSNPYLTGEIHYNQDNHATVVDVFTKRPPNNVIGRIKRGAIAVA